MTKPRARPSTAVPIDGAALRRIRMTRGIEVSELARLLQISRGYLTNLELGHRRQVSVTLHADLVRVLRPEDPDAFRTDRAKATAREEATV